MNHAFLLLFTTLCLTSCFGQTPEEEVDTNQVETEITAESPVQDMDSVTVDPANSVRWQKIDTYDETLAFSKISKAGRFSVFLLSVPWCGPCPMLRDSLGKHIEFADQVDFYYVNMCPSTAEHRAWQKTDAYFYYRFYERLKEWPTIVITSPTGTLVKRYSYTDLAEECRERKLYSIFYDEQEEADNEPGSAEFSMEAIKERLDEECHVDDWMYVKTVQLLERLLEHGERFNEDTVITELKDQAEGQSF